MQINWVIALGSGGLGVVVGIVIAFYLLDLAKTDWKALNSAIAIALGGAVLGFFKFMSHDQNPAPELWVYGIGLFFGFCSIMSIDMFISGYRLRRTDYRGPPQSN